MRTAAVNQEHLLIQACAEKADLMILDGNTN